nr:hypothetical protein [Tanacetum cinerariifolium]
MDTTIEQQVAMDEALFPRAQSAAIRTLTDPQTISSSNSVRTTPQRNIDYAYLLWEDFVYQFEHKNTKKGNEMYYPRFTKVIIHHFLSKDPSISRRNKVNWHYVRDDHMFSTIKLVSRHQNTQQFGALLPIELTNKEIRNSSAYKEYYVVATGAASPKPKANVRRTRSSSDTSLTPPTAAAGPRLTTTQKGKQTAKASKAKSLSAISKVAMTEAQQLKLMTKRSLHQTHISQASGSSADEGTGSIPGVPDVPTDESEKELSWNSTDDEGANDEGKDGDDDEEDEGDDGTDEEGEDDDDDDAQDDDAQDDDDQEDKGNDEDDQEEGSEDEQASDEEEFIHPSLSTHAEEEIRDVESFDPTRKTPENTDDEGNGEEDLRMNVDREEGQDEEDEEDELYKDININLGRGIQMGDVHTTQEFEDSHVTLTPVNPDGQQQSLSVSSQFVTSMLNLTPDAGIDSLFGFDHRLKTLEANFSEFTQTNQFAGAISSIPEIVHRYMDQRMNEAVKTIDENMQKIIKEQVKEQVKVQVSKILPKIEQTMNEQLEAKVLTRSSNSSKTSYVRNLYKALVEAYESDKIILDTYGDTVTLKRRRDDDADKDEEPSAGSDRGSKRRTKGKEPESASAPKEKATRSAGKSTQGGALSRKYTTSVTKTKAADYEHIKWIEYLVPRTMWIQEPVGYDKYALQGISHWGRKRQQLYGFAVNRESARDVYSKRRIIAITELKIVEKADKSDSQRTLYFQRLSSNVYKKHRNPKACGRPSTRCRKLPKETQPNKAGYIPLMRIDELHKFSDGTLTDVRTALDDHLKGIWMKYLPQSI